MKKLIIKLYQILPRKWIRALGKNRRLTPLRDRYLRPGGQYSISNVKVIHRYGPYKVNFRFYATLKVASDAASKGIENTLIRHSVQLFLEHKDVDNPVILDVGANFGYLALTWAQSIGQNGTVHCFEPSRSIADLVRRSAEANALEDRLIVNQVAVGKDIRPIEIFDNGIASNINQLKGHTTKYEVDMITIDKYCTDSQLENIALIKIDVDGIEYEILQGAEQTIRRFKPILVIETNNDSRILEFCSAFGYEILDMKLEPVEDLFGLPANIFCVNSDQTVNG